MKKRKRRSGAAITAIKAVKVAFKAKELAKLAGELAKRCKKLAVENRRLKQQLAKKTAVSRRRKGIRPKRRNAVTPKERAFRILSNRQKPMKLSELARRVQGVKVSADKRFIATLGQAIRTDPRFKPTRHGYYTVA